VGAFPCPRRQHLWHYTGPRSRTGAVASSSRSACVVDYPGLLGRRRRWQILQFEFAVLFCRIEVTSSPRAYLCECIATRMLDVRRVPRAMCPALAPRRTAKHCVTSGCSGERNCWSATLSAESPWLRRAPDQTHNPSVAGSSPARPTRKRRSAACSGLRVPTRTICVPRWSRIGRATVQRLMCQRRLGGLLD
jgi:hypothetical protein